MTSFFTLTHKIVFVVLICSLLVPLSFLFAVSPETALSFYEKGQEFQKNEDWFSALESYQEALKLNDSFSDVWFSMAECSYALDQYDLCLAYLENVEKYQKNDTAVLNLRGFALIGLGRLSDARAVFLNVLSFYPNDIDARFGLAELDIFDGKISGAEKLYSEALRRQTNNRKALVSLALVSHQLNKASVAKKYIEQALTYYSGESEVHYYAAWIYAKENHLDLAETSLRKAIFLDSKYIAAYELLASVLFEAGRFSEVKEICNLLISQNRNSVFPWYVLGMSELHLKNYEQALSYFETGLSIDSQDEVMRGALEIIALSQTKLEDPRRKIWADFHVKRAESFTKKFQLTQARYEYQMALRLDPYNTDMRYAYAANLLLDGYPERYLEQLKFIKERNAATLSIEDTIEAYDSLLYNTLQKKWDISYLNLDKSRWTISLYYLPNTLQPVHIDSKRVIVNMLASSFSGTPSISVSSQEDSVSGYAEAFRKSRIAGDDYFCIVSVIENEREVTLSCTMYSSKNGSELAEFSVYRTGNDKLASAIRKINQSIISLIPIRGSIIARNGNDVLIDLGRRDGIQIDQNLSVIKNGLLFPNDTTIGLTYNEENLLGTITVSILGEELSQGTLKLKGFYDLVNVGDEIFPIQMIDTETASENAPQGDTAKTTTPDIQNKQVPELLNMIRGVK